MQQNVNLPERAAECAKARREIYGQERVMEQEPRAVAETDDAQRYAHMGPGLWLLRVLHGALIGAGAILPGISGGVLCVMFGIYRPMMALLAHPFRTFRIYYRLFIPVILGWAVGFFALAGAVNLLMEASDAVAVSLFIGLIAGMVPSLYRDAGKYGHGRTGWLLDRGRVRAAVCAAAVFAGGRGDGHRGQPGLVSLLRRGCGG